jgi:hypothetical protein
MKRAVRLLAFTFGAIGLAIAGFVAPSGRTRADDEPKAAVAAIAVAVPANEDAMMKQLEQQVGGQVRNIYKRELHFMRTVCEPTKQQFEKISAAGEASIKDAIRKYAATMRGRTGDEPDPRTAITAGIAKSVKAILSPDQAARYEKEIEQRAAARKRVAILNLLSAMDKTLILTAEQRDKVKKVLEENWNESWAEPTMLYNLGYYYPTMPDDKIQVHLTDAQKKVWGGVHKGIRFGFQMNDGQEEVVDEVWDGDKLEKKPDAKEPAAGGAPAKPAEKP